MERLAILIADADEFARDLQKTHSVYPIDISQTQMETRSIHEILLELNIW